MESWDTFMQNSNKNKLKINIGLNKYLIDLDGKCCAETKK